MYLYQGLLVKQSNNKYLAVILKLDHYSDEPNCDQIMEHESNDETEGKIWLDDELNRLVNGKGVWDI